MSFSWHECEIITQIHHFGCRGLLVATIYRQGKIAESRGKVREFLFPDPVGTLSMYSNAPAVSPLVWPQSDYPRKC